MFPWSDVLSREDLAAFARAPAPLDGPLRAGRTPALLIVDMTRMFVEGAYPSGCAPASEGAVAASARLLDCARGAKIPVFFTKAYADPLHVPSEAESGLWKHGPLSLEGLPPGDVIVDALTPGPGETVVCKGSKPSAFFGTPLAAMLISLGVDTLIVTGISTSGCVRASALDGFQYNFHVLIPHEATADRCMISHKINLFDLHMKYAHVAATEAVLAYMRETGEARGGAK